MQHRNEVNFFCTCDGRHFERLKREILLYIWKVSKHSPKIFWEEDEKISAHTYHQRHKCQEG